MRDYYLTHLTRIFSIWYDHITSHHHPNIRRNWHTQLVCTFNEIIPTTFATFELRQCIFIATWWRLFVLCLIRCKVLLLVFLRRRCVVIVAIAIVLTSLRVTARTLYGTIIRGFSGIEAQTFFIVWLIRHCSHFLSLLDIHYFEKSSYTYLSTQHKAYMEGEMIKRMAHVWKERFCVYSSLDGSQLSLNLKYFDNDTLLLLLLLLMFINCLANNTFYPANETVEWRT